MCCRPDKVIPVRGGRILIQGLVPSTGSVTPYLLRVFLDVDREPPVVVTAYKTSKLEKYGSRA
jgi:hypothetical protein